MADVVMAEQDTQHKLDILLPWPKAEFVEGQPLYMIFVYYTHGEMELYSTVQGLELAHKVANLVSLLPRSSCASIEGEEWELGCWWNPVYKRGIQVQGEWNKPNAA